MKKENRKIQPEDYGQEQNASDIRADDGYEDTEDTLQNSDEIQQDDANTEEDILNMIRRFNLTSDLFASKVFENRKASGELCRILLGDDNVRVVDVRTKRTIASLERHSVELDILAQKKGGGLVGVEIQMYSEKAPFKRVRYYLSSVDMNLLEKGVDYSQLPNVTLVYITKRDIIGAGRGFYRVERHVSRSRNGGRADRKVDNGVEELYYNLRHPTGDKRKGELLRYFKNSDPDYETDTFPHIVERVRYFKKQTEGVEIMCEIANKLKNEGIKIGLEKGREEGREEGRVEGRKEGREEGIRQGIAQGRKEGVRKGIKKGIMQGRKEGREKGRVEGREEGLAMAVLGCLKDLGRVPEQVVSHIRAEKDLDVLQRWVWSAAHAASIAEFERMM